jgi:hypothetical protein
MEGAGSRRSKNLRILRPNPEHCLGQSKILMKKTVFVLRLDPSLIVPVTVIMV